MAVTGPTPEPADQTRTSGRPRVVRRPSWTPKKSPRLAGQAEPLTAPAGYKGVIEDHYA